MSHITITRPAALHFSKVSSVRDFGGEASKHDMTHLYA